MPDGVGYEDDFFLWSQDQAERLRAAEQRRVNAAVDAAVDWEHLAEEIEGLGRSERRELWSRIETILAHLLKLQFSPAADPRANWIATVRRERKMVHLLLADSPSLARFVPGFIEDASGSARELATSDVTAFGEKEAAARIELTPAVRERMLDASFIPHPPGPST